MKTFISELEQHQAMMERLVGCSDAIEAAGELLINTLKQGGKILLCGNGGSAADCQHIAAELVGLVTHSVIVPSAVTARIQEAHILIGHWWCGVLDDCMDVGDTAPGMEVSEQVPGAIQGTVAEEAY
ncbi:MAG: SIS domain-containing protein [Methylococcaceae bacterium]